MEELNKITSRRVKEALDDKIMIASELSRKTGLSRSAISQYIKGTYIPVGRAAQLMGEVLGVNPKWLAGTSDDKHVMEITWKDHSKEKTLSFSPDIISRLPDDIIINDKEIIHLKGNDKEHYERQANRALLYSTILSKNLSAGEVDLIDLWRKAPLNIQQQVYTILSSGGDQDGN